MLNQILIIGCLLRNQAVGGSLAVTARARPRGGEGVFLSDLLSWTIPLDLLLKKSLINKFSALVATLPLVCSSSSCLLVPQLLEKDQNPLLSVTASMFNPGT